MLINARSGFSPESNVKMRPLLVACVDLKSARLGALFLK